MPGIVFVLGCDRTALRRAVDDAVGVDDPPGAAEYLEKIIQVTHTIPAPSPSQAMRLVEGYLARSYTGQLFNEPMKSLIIERSGRNPRRIKGMINDFMLAYHLNRSLDNVDARRAAWGQPSASAGELLALFSAHVAYLDFDAPERSFDSPARARAVAYRRQATRTDWPWIRGKPPLREGRDVLGIRIVWIDDHSEIDRRMALALAAIAHEPPEVVLSGDLKQVEAGSP